MRRAGKRPCAKSPARQQNGGLNQEPATSRLPRKRLAAVAVFVGCLALLLSVLFVAHVIQERGRAPKPLDYLADQKTGYRSPFDIDPLGIAGDELIFEEATKDGRITWYRTGLDAASSRALFDRVFVSQQWVVTSEWSYNMASYIRPVDNEKLFEHASVVCYEQSGGCSIVVEVL